MSVSTINEEMTHAQIFYGYYYDIFVYIHHFFITNHLQVFSMIIPPD